MAQLPLACRQSVRSHTTPEYCRSLFRDPTVLPLSAAAIAGCGRDRAPPRPESRWIAQVCRHIPKYRSWAEVAALAQLQIQLSPVRYSLATRRIELALQTPTHSPTQRLQTTTRS